MADARTRFWAGLETCLIFNAEGVPDISVKAISHTGVTYTTGKLHSDGNLYIASSYQRHSVVEVNIGETDQAYAIVHGELSLEGADLPTHLLITWLHWDDEEPVYQSDYPLEDDEVMPSDEIDIIPCTMLSGLTCPLEDLPNHSDGGPDDGIFGGIFWRRSHVYISETASVVPLDEAVQLEPRGRWPDPDVKLAAQRRYMHERRDASSPTSPSKRHKSGDRGGLLLMQPLYPAVSSTSYGYSSEHSPRPTTPLTS